MDKSPKHMEATTHESAADQPLDQSDMQRTWSTIQSQVARAVPRLREIATTTALLAPIFFDGNSWGDGGRGGC